MHQLQFRDHWKDSVWYSPAEISDGSMLVLAYLISRYQSPQVDLLAIEEPERGLHPYLLEQLVAFFRAMTQSEDGKDPQIVLAAHSAELLSHIEPREVRFLRRSEADGSTIVQRAPEGDARWPEYFKAYEESLGGAWLSGGLGGVPGT